MEQVFFLLAQLVGDASAFRDGTVDLQQILCPSVSCHTEGARGEGGSTRGGRGEGGSTRGGRGELMKVICGIITVLTVIVHKFISLVHSPRITGL